IQEVKNINTFNTVLMLTKCVGTWKNLATCIFCCVWLIGRNAENILQTTRLMSAKQISTALSVTKRSHIHYLGFWALGLVDMWTYRKKYVPIDVGQQAVTDLLNRNNEAGCNTRWLITEDHHAHAV
ncbi:hypothetical protein ACJX0J_034621, partial [Zea mays]